MKLRTVSIRKRILVLGYVTILFLVVVMIAISMSVFTKNYTSAVYDQTDMLAEAYSSSVSNIASRVYNEIGRASKDTEIAENFRDMSVENLQTYLIDEKTGRTHDFMFYTLSLLDSKGVTYDNYDLSKREYVRKALAGQPNISSPVFSAKDKIMTYYVAQKMDNGIKDGIVFAGLDISYFYDIIKSYEESNDYGGLAFIVDSNGTYIVNSDEQKVTDAVNPIAMAADDKSYEDSAKLVSEMIKLESGRGKVKLDNGVKYYVSYMPINSPDGWSIAVLIPQTRVTYPVTETFVLILVMGIIALAAATLAYTHYSKKIAAPIIDAADRIKRLEAGDLRTPVGLCNYTDETELLTTSLSNTVRILSEYVSDISNVLEQISEGNLNVEIERNYGGDFAPLRESLNNIVNSLNSVMNDINRSSTTVSYGSEQVANAAVELTAGVSAQKNAIDELSVTIDEISKMVKSNAMNARIASENSADQSRLIESGNVQMKKMMEAMEEINSTSSQIASIIKTIDGIAFQTNILALNAAVEAAKAGSSGKGFAVVADEVRNLASKSAEAARITTTLIESSITAIENGARIAEETAHTLEKIVVNSAETTKLIKEISSASEEQANSIADVTGGVEQILSVVKTNSASSEGSAASAEELSSEAQMLYTLVGRFRIRDGK